MQLSSADLESICQRASTLSERLSGQYVPTGNDAGDASRRLARWRELAGADASLQLASLLSAGGNKNVPEPKLLALLGPVRRATNVPLPPWAFFLEEMARSVADFFCSDVDSPKLNNSTSIRKRNIPFEHLYGAIAEFAWEHILRRSPSALAKFGPRVHKSLQRHLVQRISNIASMPLQTAFLAHIAVERSGVFHHLFSASSSRENPRDNTRHYTQFILKHGKSGLHSLFTDFPVAARLIAEVSLSWIEFIAEFFERLQKDISQLSERFNAGNPLGTLLDVKAGLSDPHQGGRSVLILHFERGLKLVYKPRPMDVDRAFYEMVREFNARSPDLHLGSLTVYVRSSYGWMEFCGRAECQDGSAAKRYYRRAGALACLVHRLWGIDFHRENVVAAGEYPVLVDLECLAHPLRPEEIVHAMTRSPSALINSALRSGLLPLWQPRIGMGSLYDNCGFNGPVRQRSFLPALIWQEVNTDRMQWVWRTQHHYHDAHRASLNGRLLQIQSFENEVVSGFKKMARRIDGAVGGGHKYSKRLIEQSCRRFVKRATFIYAVLIRQSLDIKFLREGVDRSIELMALPIKTGEGAHWCTEVASLEKMDIPFFQHSSRAQDANAPFDMDMAESGIHQQAEIIRLSVRQMAKLSDGMILGGGSSRNPRRARDCPKATPAK